MSCIDSHVLKQAAGFSAYDRSLGHSGSLAESILASLEVTMDLFYQGCDGSYEPLSDDELAQLDELSLVHAAIEDAYYHHHWRGIGERQQTTLFLARYNYEVEQRLAAINPNATYDEDIQF